MLHPKSSVQWLDISSGKSYTGFIEDLFTMYATYAKSSNYASIIDFSLLGKNVKITDMHGWTDITVIKKRINMTEDDSRKWVNIFTEDCSVTVYWDQLIPTYDMNAPIMKGFHGSIIRPYILKHPDKINPDDHIRIKHDHEYTKVIRFGESSGVPVDNGYTILTKSRFCNVDNVYTFAAEEVTLDELDRMGFDSSYEYPN